MSTQTIDSALHDELPILPEADIERLLAEMFANARKLPPRRPAPAPEAPRIVQEAAVRAVEPAPRAVEPEPIAFAHAPAFQPAAAFREEAAAALEPLRLPRKRRMGRVLLLAVALPALALGAGWWAASNGMASGRIASAIESLTSLASLNSSGGTSQAFRSPPVIAAPPPPSMRVPAPTDTTPVEASAASPVSAPQPAAAPPVAQPSPAPAKVAVIAAPPESAGVLGTAQQSPFDTLATPRAVRTTAVLPPAAATTADASASTETVAKPIDFDDPATWPAGASKAEPHPLPPRRR
ncbi:hypothetical protein [Terrarubrum flagellatum]|uniref:hypothetical protein n=1 Tax=Terrirubrum flagellatum TaxID=2895980 RepID=UPI003144D5F9